jgi:NADP-dependent aldehyde dehydrogenase
MKDQPETLAQQYAGSINLGVGQFCTNPGLMFTVDSPATATFDAALAKAIEASGPGTMLHPSVKDGYEERAEKTFSQKGVSILSEGRTGHEMQAKSQVATVSAGTFASNPVLQEEVFGPASLQIKCDRVSDIPKLIESMKGQLTITVMGNEVDLAMFAPELTELRERCGRLIFNGVPTGVEVCHSMHHGGPYPATTDSRFTSVGTGAIKRFVRPIAFQSCPDSSLPPELQESNPLQIWRLQDGSWKK